MDCVDRWIWYFPGFSLRGTVYMRLDVTPGMTHIIWWGDSISFSFELHSVCHSVTGTFIKETACKGWMTRANQNLEKVLTDTAAVTITNLVPTMGEIGKRWASRDEHTIEDDMVLLNDINTAADFRYSVMKSWVSAMEKFDELAVPVPDPNADNCTNVSTSPVGVKSPKSNLPKFAGDVLQRPSFWDQFSVTVHGM